MRYSIAALAAASTTLYAHAAASYAGCTPIPGTIAHPAGSPQIDACAHSLKLGDACGADQQCPPGVECFGSTAGTIPACGKFNAGCTSDDHCASNTCNNGLCNGFKPTTTTSPAAAPTSSCAAPGTKDAQGRYSCNPAHQYPAGQTCEMRDGCPVLVTPGGGSPPTTSCAAPGTQDAQGRYSCNPAHQYPAGQTCEMRDGCPVLVTAGSPTTTSPTGAPTASCAAPGTKDAQGRYSCNPAHQYPAGQTCEMRDGCPVLVTAGSGSPSTPGGGAAPAPVPSSNCPAPGSTSASGQYSCNPAHAYPEGQTCQLVGGCYVLVGGGAAPAPYGSGNTTTPGYGAAPTGTGVAALPSSTSGPTPYAGGASVTGALSGLAALVAGAVAFVL